MSGKGGGMASDSTKQKLNTRSSTTSELVAADDFLPKIIWVKHFLAEQGIKLDQNVLYQDNPITMLLEKVVDYLVVSVLVPSMSGILLLRTALIEAT